MHEKKRGEHGLPFGVFKDSHPPARVIDAWMDKSNQLERPLNQNEMAEIAFTVSCEYTFQMMGEFLLDPNSDLKGIRHIVETKLKQLGDIRNGFNY